MKDKKDIVENWLPRYTGTPLSEFGEHILLTNFDNYVEWFATAHGGIVKGIDRPMPNATAEGITFINFGMGSPNAATVMDLLSAIAPKAVLFLGKMRRTETQESDWRPGPADRSHSGRGYVERLPAAGSPRATRVPVATRGVDDDPGSRSRLLDGYRVHDQSSRLGTR